MSIRDELIVTDGTTWSEIRKKEGHGMFVALWLVVSGATVVYLLKLNGKWLQREAVQWDEAMDGTFGRKPIIRSMKLYRG